MDSKKSFLPKYQLNKKNNEKKNKTKQKQKTRTLLLQRKYEKFSSGGTLICF